MSEINEWTRFWCPIDETSYNDQNGYLFDPILGQFSANSHLIDNPFEKSERCIILLGEPGIGKTTAMEKFYNNFESNYRTNNTEVNFIRLEHIGTEMRFVSEVFENPKFQEWLESDYDLHLLLDSFDECVLRINVLSQLLINQLQRYPIERLYIRIACRTGHWSDILQRQLIILFGENNFKAYRLTNLRKKDIEITANAEIEQGDDRNTMDFINKLEIIEAVPFAVHPVTLRILINLYNREGTLPETKTEIYRRGCLTLCEEIAPSRRDTSIGGNYSSEQRYVAAARFAAYCAFSRKSGIWLNIDLGDVPDDFIPESEIRGGNEFLGNHEFNISRELVTATISCGLYTSSRPGREWAHRTFMEFLAADYVIQKNIQSVQIQSLIRNPFDPSNRINPHLRGTVAWICSNNQELYDEILIQEPEILFQSDTGLFTDEKKEEIIGMILANYDESPFKSRYYDYRHLIKKFKHDRIDTQISQFINETSNSYGSKRFALLIAEECELLSLTSQIIDLILNEDENTNLRVAAARAIESFSNSNQIEGLENLIPIIVSDEDLDDQKDLKGVCLHIVWPDLIEFTDLIVHLPEPNIGYAGAYSRFLLGHFIDELPYRDIVHALSWIRERVILSNSISVFRRVVEKILLKSLNFLDDNEILEAIKKTLCNLIKDDHYLNEMSFGSELRSILENNTELRRKLLIGVLQILPNDNIILTKLSMNIVSYIHSQPRLFELIYESDFNWMLQELGLSIEGEYRDKLINLILRMLRNRSDKYEKGFELFMNNDILKPNLIGWYGPIDINSDLASEMRRDHERELELQNMFEELRRDEPQPQIEPPPEERIRLLLDNFDQGNIDAFSRLNRELTLTVNSREYGNPFISNLKKFSGWINLQPEVQNRIIIAAKTFIVQGEPNTNTWLNNNSFSHNALAGYRALRIIYEIEEEYIHNLSDEIWEKWIPIVLLFPINLTENGKEEQIRMKILKIAYPHAKESFFLALSAEIDKENQNNRRLFIIDRISNMNDNELLNFIHRKALEQNLANQSKGDLFTFLLKNNYSLSIEYINNLLLEGIPEDPSLRDLTIQAAKVVVLYSSESHWEVIWPLIQNDEEWGKEVLGEIADNDRFSKKVYNKYSEMQLAKLYIWLVTKYPPETDISFTTGARLYTRDDHIRGWRDHIIRYLVSKGSFEAVDAIRYLMENLPERSENLSYSLINAIENARNYSWEPPNSKELHTLFENPTSRLVKSGKQLLDLISESLSRLEDKFQGKEPYSPAARFLWDLVSNREFKPVGEEDLSDYVKNHLYDDISQDVVIHREVEISQATRTDILITIINSKAILPQNRKITTIVEVKGKWNQELRTAMENQLLNDYLIPRHINYGIYLVGWFDSQHWDERDYRKNRNNTIENIEDLRDILDEQAREISNRGIIIKPIILDISLSEIH